MRTWLQTIFMKKNNQKKQNFGLTNMRNFIGQVVCELKCVKCGQAFSAGPFDTDTSTFVCPICDNGKDD